jgi:hypothetical protein
VVKQPAHEADLSNLVPKMMGAEPSLVHMPHGVVLQLSPGYCSVLRIEIFTTVIIKYVFPNVVSFWSSLLSPSYDFSESGCDRSVNIYETTRYHIPENNIIYNCFVKAVF